MDDIDWTGFTRQANGQRAGMIYCERCGANWHVPRCWLQKPSPACRAVLARHRESCQSLPELPGSAGPILGADPV